MPTLVACASNLARCLRTRGAPATRWACSKRWPRTVDHSKMVPGSTTCRPWQACWTTLRCINLKPGTPSARSRDSHRGGCEISSTCRRSLGESRSRVGELAQQPWRLSQRSWPLLGCAARPAGVTQFCGATGHRICTARTSSAARRLPDQLWQPAAVDWIGARRR
jgi:hypothetical protein